MRREELGVAEWRKVVVWMRREGEVAELGGGGWVEKSRGLRE